MKRKIVLITVLLLAVAAGFCTWQHLQQRYLVISDYKTQAVYAQHKIKPGDRLFFGWVHSLEKIPWHEYYHVSDKDTLVLETISFPAFGAGIPANRGKKVRTEGGLIYMEEINEEFQQFDWLNSHFATRDIKINGELWLTGKDLPEHERLIMKIKRGGF